MIASRQSSAKSIARTSLAFYIRDESRAADCELVVVPVKVKRKVERDEVVLSHACRSGRDAGLAGSIGALASVLLHRGETTWQQRRNVVAKQRLRRPPEHASGAKRPEAHRRARARARVQGRRQLVVRPPARARVSGGSALRAKQTEKPAISPAFLRSRASP